MPDIEGDTIFAVATGARRAAIAIVRLSGPSSPAIAAAMTGQQLVPRVASLVRLRDPKSGETLDRCIAIAFEAGRSETGEAGTEFHLHGSPAVVAAVLATLARQPGVRPAEPGEFARRAFRNGLLDLAQLEGLADLIDAETEWQRRQAQRQLSGVLRAKTAPWREALLRARADVETAIDFADDVDLAEGLHERIRASIDPIRGALAEELLSSRAAERVRDGVQVVIAGPPNAGKSTLLNTLARRDAAIVSSVAGTTRDPIEVHLDLDGLPMTLIDTAGLHDSEDEIEQIGIRRAKDRAEAADLVLWIRETDEAPPAFGPPVWPIRSKAEDGVAPAGGALAISAHSGRNIEVLVARLAEFAADLLRSAGEGVLVRQRHREAFQAAATALDAVAVEPTMPAEIVAEHLRQANHALERLVGAVDVEDILGSIFSRFCIGK